MSAEVRGNLVKVEEELARTRADIKLVEKENLHFTVKFLGEIPESAVGEIDRRMAGLTIAKMDVEVLGLGAFPNPRRARVVWAGVAPHDLAQISGAGERVIEAMEGVGERDERAFHPHITVARVRSPRGLDALASAIGENSARGFGRSGIDSLKLKASTLSPAGPTYRDVREYALK